jgi:hypothetical protein
MFLVPPGPVHFEEPTLKPRKGKVFLAVVIAAMHGLAYNMPQEVVRCKVSNPKMVEASAGGAHTAQCCVDSGSGTDLINMEFIHATTLKHTIVGKYKGPTICGLTNQALTDLQLVRILLEIGSFATHIILIGTSNIYPFRYPPIQVP